MKEKIQEFDIDINFKFLSQMTIEAESEKEALRLAQKRFMDIIKDHLRDKDNLNVRIKSVHTITPEERQKLEYDNIIEPITKKERKIRKAKEENTEVKKIRKRRV